MARQVVRHLPPPVADALRAAWRRVAPPPPVPAPPPKPRLERAVAIGEQARRPGYVDVHNWVFTPHHLRLLLQDLHALDYIALREARFQETVGHEFFLNLTADGPGTGLSREELVMRSDAELRGLDVPVFGKPA